MRGVTNVSVKAKIYVVAMAMIFRAAMADPAVDVIHVMAPNDLHAPQVRQIVWARKRVVCEKPLALTSADGMDRLTPAETAGAVRAVRFSVRFYPVIHLRVTWSPRPVATILRTFGDCAASKCRRKL